MNALGKKITGGLAAVEQVILIILASFMILIILVQVCNRYLVEVTGMIGGYTEELARLAFIWMSFLGSFLVLREGKHYRMVLIVNRLPSRVQSIARNFSDFGSIIFLIIVLSAIIPLTVRSITMFTPALMWPYAVFQSAIAVSTILMIVYLGVRVFMNFLKLWGRRTWK